MEKFSHAENSLKPSHAVRKYLLDIYLRAQNIFIEISSYIWGKNILSNLSALAFKF